MSTQDDVVQIGKEGRLREKVLIEKHNKARNSLSAKLVDARREQETRKETAFQYELEIQNLRNKVAQFEKQQEIRNLKEMMTQYQKQEKPREKKQSLEHANLVAALKEEIGQAYKEGELRGYLRHAIDVDAVRAKEGHVKGVTFDPTSFPHLVDVSHEYHPTNMGAKVGHMMIGAYAAQEHRIEELDTRVYKADVVMDGAMILTCDQSDRDAGTFWAGLFDSLWKRKLEYDIVVEQDSASKRANAALERLL
ncbi:hypothetical protein NX059_003143 [Plenodomus lindquistii]|nr:hypothetical protein NX059_003143 [Plenodomus lindquistii]